MKGQCLFYEKNCEICGKLLFPTTDWAYKIRRPLEPTKYYCSWSHYRQALKENEEKGIKKYRRYNGY